LKELFDPKNIDQIGEISEKLTQGFLYELIFWSISDWNLCKKTVEFILEKLLQNKDVIASEVFMKVLFVFSGSSENEGIENLAEQILDTGKVDINDITLYGESLLEHSSDVIYIENSKFIKTLIAKGANVNKQSDKDENTALMRTIERLNVFFMEELLKSEELDVNLVNKNGDTALLMLSSTENFSKKESIVALKLLLNTKNIDINYKDKDGNTALMKLLLTKQTYSSDERKKKVEALDLLLKHNASAFILNKAKTSPWQSAKDYEKAILKNSISIQYKQIKEKFNENKIDALNKHNEEPRLEQLMINFKNTLNHNFAIISNLLYFGVDITEDIKELFDFYSKNIVKTDNNIYTKIVELMGFRKESPTTKIFADYFIKMDIGGANIFLKIINEGLNEAAEIILRFSEIKHIDQDNKKILESALIAASDNNAPNLVNMLLDVNGLNINVSGMNSRTALMKAAGNGNLSLFERLIELGANIDQRDCSNESAIFHAVKKDREDIVKRLIELKATLNFQNQYGETILILAAQLRKNNQIVKELIQEDGIDIEQIDNFGNNALITACYWGNFDAAKELMLAGASVIKQNEKGKTALMVAVQDNDFKDLDLLTKMRDAGYNFKTTDNNGNTVLFYAFEKGNIELAQELLKLDSLNINDKNHLGNTAIITSIENRQCGSIEFLLKNNVNLLISHYTEDHIFTIYRACGEDLRNLFKENFAKQKGINVKDFSVYDIPKMLDIKSFEVDMAGVDLLVD
jgi:ankyrin repeat protein